MSVQNQVLNQAALFCDETRDYKIPPEPESFQNVTLRFRTGKDNIDKVFYIEDGTTLEMEMEKVETKGLFDYYEHTIFITNQPKSYFFQIIKGNEICYYNRLGATSDIKSCFSFRIIPGFHTPDWAKGAVIYQIYVDRFYNGDEENDVKNEEYLYIGRPVKKIDDWYQPPSAMDVGNFYGGDLQGVLEKLDYLQYLGIEVLYLNPIFVSPSNHKYDCQDYENIDPHYGKIVRDHGVCVGIDVGDNANATKYQCRSADRENLKASNQLFIDLVKEVHKRGMKFIIDGVFNHCGSFNKWLDAEGIYQREGSYEPGAYWSKESPYYSFFKFYEEHWPQNSTYDGWWGHLTLPKLNYEQSPKLMEYILAIARKWIAPPYEVDGWRLDVAADLGHSSDFNHKFWREFRKAVKEANQDALILAEHYGDPGSWLEGDQWDTVMNYDGFMEPVSWFLTGMEKHSDESNEALFGDGETFFRTMAYHMSRMPFQSLYTAMNELSNHDHSRFLTRTNQTVGRVHTHGFQGANTQLNYGLFRAGVLLQMTWPGAPTVYYGDEAGLCGWTDPDNRRTYPWGKEHVELIEFHRYLIQMHKQYEALRIGSLKPLLAQKNQIAYARFLKKCQCIIVINVDSHEQELKIPVWLAEVGQEQNLTRVMLTYESGYNVGAVVYPTKEGILNVILPPYASALFVKQ